MFGAHKKFMASVVAHFTVEQYVNLGPLNHLFKNAEVEEFAAFDKHVRSHGVIPHKDTFAGMIEGKVPDAPEPPTFYLDYLKNRHFDNVLSKSAETANELLSADKGEDAARFLMDEIGRALITHQGNRVLDFREAYALVQTQYFHQMKSGDEYGVRLGYPVVDDYGGLLGGDVLSLVGRPAAGKSFLTLRGAHRVWSVQQKPPAFISMEMNNLLSAQRVVAMDAGIPLANLKLQKGKGLTTVQMEKVATAKKLAAKSEVPFYLMDGNLRTTVEDIYNFCRLTNPAVVFIDGAYLLKHTNPRLGRYERVAENCELIKQEIAGNLGIPVVCSWQFSRDASKKLKGGKKGSSENKVDLEDIGYSDAIGQISSIVLGLLEEETVETLTKKTITIMKGRSGETGQFPIHWQFHPTMNFDMYVEPQASELQFL